MAKKQSTARAPLHRGAEGPDVTQLQTILLELGLSITTTEVRERRFGDSTAQALSQWQEAHDLPVADAIGPEALDLLISDGRDVPRTVFGVVSLVDGTPVPNLRVVAIDRDFRAEQVLGEARTDDLGRYRIGYRGADALRAEKVTADLGIRVFATDGSTLLHAPTSRDLVMNAPAQARIDIRLTLAEGAVPSEFARIGATLAPLIDQVPVADIGRDPTSDEGDFLSSESGVSIDRLAHFVVAHRLTDDSEVPAEYFYALLREDGLFGVGRNRPRAVLTPVDLGTDTRAVLYEAVLLEPDAAKAALKRAIRRHLVGPELLRRFPEIQERLQRWRGDALEHVERALPRRVFDVLDDLVSADRAADLMAVLRARSIDDLPKLLERLDAQRLFSPADRPAAAARLQLADLLGFNVGLVAEVTESVGANSPDEVRKLAQLQRKDWTRLIESGNVRMGGAVVERARARQQASVIVRRFEKEFPTAAFSAQLARRKPKAVAHHGEVVAFFDAHPEFELGTHKLQPFLKDKGVDSRRVAPEVVAEVEKLQRMFRLTGDYRKTEGLVTAGFRSSADIVAAGKSRFLKEARHGAGMGKAEASRAFETAANLNFAAVNVATNLRALSVPGALEGDAALQFAKRIALIMTEQPDLKALFGPTDVCACSHCRSIYSPAAYFADVMRFLRNRLVRDTTVLPVVSTKTAKDVLFARRPDLGEIDLNCDNAHIPVPHIDIVCELLEEAVAPDPGFAFNGAVVAGAASAGLLAAIRAQGLEVEDQALVHGPYTGSRFMLRDKGITVAVDGPGPNWKLRRLRQTHGSAQERAAAPEYLNVAAYTALAAGKAAFFLPFDLFHTETRALLHAAGVERADLMAALAVGGTPSSDAIAGEALGVSASERSHIFSASVAAQPAVWGVAGPLAADAMRKLDVFTSRTGLAYAEVESLIRGTWVRSGVALSILHLNNSCNLADKEIANLDDKVLDRMHRVLRLARRTGLAVRDLDRLAAGPRLGAMDLGSAALQALPQLIRVAADLKVEVARLITWLDRIVSEGDASEHALLFQNPAATGALDPGLTPEAIAANEVADAAVPGSGVRLSAVAPDLALAFGVTASDLQLLLAHVASPPLLGNNPPLTANGLAALYGRIGLARALGLKIADYLGLERLCAFDPLGSASKLAALVDAARRIESFGVPIAELEFRLARRASSLAAWDLADATITPLLEGIRTALVAADTANRSPFDAALTAFEQIGALETLLQKQPDVAPGQIAALTDLLRTDTPTVAAATAAKAVVDGPLTGRVGGVAVKAAIDAIVAAPGVDAQRKALVQALMQGLSASARRDAADAAAGAALTALLSVSADMADTLLRGVQLQVAAVSTPLVELLTGGTLANPAVALSPAGTPDLYRALRLAHAVAELISPFAPAPEAVAFMLKNAAAMGSTALDATPFEGPSPAPAAATVALADWLSLADTFKLIDRYPPVPVPGQPDRTVSALSVFTLAMGAGPKATLLDAVALLTGWPGQLLGDVDTRLAWALADYRRPSTWAATGRAVELVHQLGAPLAEAVLLAAETVTDAERRSARRLLRARYDPADWLGALKALMDPIRERKRDALVAHLLASKPALTGKADLYDHYLTDTEWSARMPSSRLVHAHSTLQLFIRRCMEGLEPTAVADLEGDTDWNWWDWMKNYRVWEVGRKVFVEAQYYLRSEWRDDKTEGFAEFESNLLQNEINDENTTAAYEGYLDHLDKIAFLDVLATCYDFDLQNLHVIGATKGGDPRTYFHRMLQRERVWTPWKKIDLDIAGEHLIAFFRNRRLYLAWATFIEKGDDQQQAAYPQPASGQQDMPKSKRWTEISLAVSEYTGKKWLPRRISADPVCTEVMEKSLDQSKIVLSVSPDPENFSVDVYLEWDKNAYQYRIGAFLLTGCKGYPEARQASGPSFNFLPRFKDTRVRGQRLVEQGEDSDDQLALMGAFSGSNYQTLFGRTFGDTPAVFRVSYPLQASEIDRLLAFWLYGARNGYARDLTNLVFGTFMPFFVEDNRHGYVLTPGFYGPVDPHTGSRSTIKTFSNIRQLFLDVLALAFKYLALMIAAPDEPSKKAVVAQLLADPEFARILQEFAVYRSTRFGIVVRNFYHPLACRLRERFFQGGVPALLARATQLETGSFRFEDMAGGYAPDPIILPPYPREEMEFDRSSAYADINWELTVHAPRMIAAKLCEQETVEGYDAAEKWLRYMFDPRGSSNDPAPQKYWNTKPFYLRTAADYAQQLVSAIMDKLAHDPNGAVETELADAVLEWRRSPFKPFLVARSRTVAFQDAIKYDTAKLFIGRGNAHFRIDQLESLVMAGLDYSRAERLLPRRPQVVPPAVEVPPETYNQLESRLDLFGNALCRLENLLPDLSGLPPGESTPAQPPLSLESLYFCIPPSDKLFALWDELEERQFNLRNSRTIDGVERELSLFAPALSVEALIQAAASGLSVSAVLAGLSAPRPPYRFKVMLRHAIELAEVAAAFSQKLEQALTARDGEGLQRLKAEHEGLMLAEQTSALQQEILAAGHAIAGAQKVRQMQQETQKFYAERPYMNAWEIAATISYGVSLALQAVVAIGYAASGGLALVPSFMIGAAGFGGSPTANVQTGGKDYSSSARDFVVGAVGALSAAMDKAGAMLDKQGTYLVRQEDWQNSARTARREAERADIDVKIAQIRQAIATENLRVHGVRQQQSAAEETYLRTKFTNRELFDWLAGNLRGLSRQMYNLAFEAARAAERCFNFELGTIDSFVRAGQWDASRRGLLAAENLVADLRRMDSAYLQRHVRDREVTKHVSLARLDPTALTELRMSGRCVIQVPEAIFDLDHPGHYFRRIKALSITVPSVVGPYGSVPLKLTQTSNRIRVETGRKPGAATDVEAYSEDPAGDSRFRYNVGAIQSISLSRGQDDAGLFNLNLDDERYLPFEGSGVVGTYTLELPQTLRSFDYGTISDVVLHFRYTARDGGGALRALAANTLRERLNVLALKTGRTGLFQAFDVRRDLPDVWHRLTVSGSATLNLTSDDLPYFTSGHAASITATRIIARVNGAPASQAIAVGGNPVNLNAAPEPELGGLLAASVNGVALAAPLTIAAPISKLSELIVIVNYSLTV